MANVYAHEYIKEYHKKIKPAIQRLIEIHSTWGSPIIIEGWAIYPDIMEKIRSDSISAIWLITDESLLRKRLIDNANFYKNAVDPIAMRENYLSRSIWHNNFLLEQCKKKNQKFLLLSGRESLDELFARIEV